MRLLCLEIACFIQDESSPKITPEKMQESLPYLKNFAEEIDSYIRELNSFVEQKQGNINDDLR